MELNTGEMRMVLAACEVARASCYRRNRRMLEVLGSAAEGTNLEEVLDRKLQAWEKLIDKLKGGMS